MQPAAPNLRDRTAEYFSTFEVLRSQMIQAEAEAAESANALRSAAGGSAPKKAPPNEKMETILPTVHRPTTAADMIPAQSRFTEAASKISKRIGDVAGKLEKLTQLARQRSNFDDPVVEVGRLAASIKDEVQSLDADIEELDRFAKQNRDGNGRQSSASDHAIVVSLKSKLATNVSSLGSVLSLRTKNLKDQSARKKNFDSSASTSATSASAKRNKPRVDPFQALLAAKPVATAMELDPNAPADDDSMGGDGGMEFKHRTPHPRGNGNGAAASGAGKSLQLNANGQVAFDAEFSTDDAKRPASAGAEQDQMQVAVAEQDTYLQSRVDAVQTIEKTLVEVAELYRRLIEIIGQQDEMIIRIDEDTSTALANVEAGQSELYTYLKSIESNKWLLIKIFAVLILFGIFFVGFVA